MVSAVEIRIPSDLVAMPFFQVSMLEDFGKAMHFLHER